MEPANETAFPQELAEESRALQSRLKRLQERVGTCRGRLKSQNQAVADIRRDALDLEARAAALKESAAGMTARLQALEAGIAQTPAPWPPTPAPVPREAQPEPSAAATGQGKQNPLLEAVPYLIILAAGLGYGLKSQASPTPQPMAIAWPAPQQEPIPQEDGPANATLQLVYEYRLPGTQGSMLDLVGAQEAVPGPSPWTIECADEDRCTASFNGPAGADDNPLYEFDVDLAAKTVTPSSATAQRLRSASLAQNSRG